MYNKADGGMAIMWPRMRTLALLFLAAIACAAAMDGYFPFGGTGAALSCFFLFLLTAAVRPTRREWGLGAISAALFAFFRTAGYSYDTTDSYGLLLRNAETLLSGMLAMAALFAAALCAVILIFRLLDALRARAVSDTPATKAEKRRLFWLCAGLIFAGSIPYLILYAPGLNIFDTHDQILQFFGFPSYIGDGNVLSDHHPVFLTVVYGGFMKLGLLLGDANIGQLLYSLTSMAALALCWAYALVTLREMGLARGAVLGLAAFVALYPVLALYAFNMCKDVSVEPFVLLYGTMMLKLYATDGQIARSKRFCAALFAAAMMMLLTRKPAMYALCFAVLFLALGYRGVRLRLAGVMLGAAAAFAVLYSGVILPACGVIPGETREMLSIPFQQTTRYLITYPDDVTQVEMDAIADVLDVEHATQNYDPRLADAVKDTSNPELSGRLAPYMKAWLSMGLRHPGVYIDAWLNMIYGYFYPSESNTIVCLTLNSPNEGGVNLRQNPALEGARLELHNQIYYRLRRIPIIGSLFYVDTVTWVFLLLLAALILRDGIRAAWPYMFFFGTLGICLLSPKSGEIRYLMPILYILPVMLGAALLPADKEKKR